MLQQDQPACKILKHALCLLTIYQTQSHRGPMFQQGQPTRTILKQALCLFTVSKPRVTLQGAYISTRSTYSHNIQTSIVFIYRLPNLESLYRGPMFQQGQPTRTIFKRALCLFTVYQTQSHSVLGLCFNKVNLLAQYSNEHCVYLNLESLCMFQHGHNYVQNTKNNVLFIFCLLNQSHSVCLNNDTPTCKILKTTISFSVYNTSRHSV